MNKFVLHELEKVRKRDRAILKQLWMDWIW